MKTLDRATSRNVSRPRTTAARIATLALAVLLAPALVQAGKAHQHGVARLDVSVEGQQLTLSLDTPLDNLLGFERAPRNAAERQRAQTMTEQLRKASELFQTDAAAGCTAGTVELESPVLGLGAAPAKPAAGDHADLSARFVFTCTRPEALRQVDVGLFKTFSGFKRIETQIVTPKGQARRNLTPAAARLQMPS